MATNPAVIVSFNHLYLVDRDALDVADEQSPLTKTKGMSTFHALSDIMQERFSDSLNAAEVLERFATHDPLNATTYLLTHRTQVLAQSSHPLRMAIGGALNVVLDQLPRGNEEHCKVLQQLFRSGDVLLSQYDEVGAARMVAKAVIADAVDRKEKSALPFDGVVCVATSQFIFTQFEDVVGNLTNSNHTPIIGKRMEIIHIPMDRGRSTTLADTLVVKASGYLEPDATSLGKIDPQFGV